MQLFLTVVIFVVSCSHAHGHGHGGVGPRPRPPIGGQFATKDDCTARVLQRQQCDFNHPCPTGYLCLFNPCTPGYKMCINGTKSQDTAHPAGKCPSAVGTGTACFVHQDCSSGERCCSSVCTKALAIDPAPQVTVLLDGALKTGLANNALEFNSSVGLVQSAGKNVLFDTGDLTHAPDLMDALARNGLGPEDIDTVLGSHGKGTVGLVGDTFLYGDDYKSPLSPATAQYANSRKLVGCVADWIVPGHGDMFQVTPDHRKGYNCTT